MKESQRTELRHRVEELLVEVERLRDYVDTCFGDDVSRERKELIISQNSKISRIMANVSCKIVESIKEDSC